MCGVADMTFFVVEESVITVYHMASHSHTYKASEPRHGYSSDKKIRLLQFYRGTSQTQSRFP